MSRTTIVVGLLIAAVVQCAFAVFRSAVDRQPVAIGFALGLLVLSPILRELPIRWLSVVCTIVGVLFAGLALFAIAAAFNNPASSLVERVSLPILMGGLSALFLPRDNVP